MKILKIEELQEIYKNVEFHDNFKELIFNTFEDKYLTFNLESGSPKSKSDVIKMFSDKLNEEIEKLKSQPSSYENGDTSTGQVANPFSSETTPTKVRISVTGYDEGKKTYLQKDIAYVVTVLDSQNPDNGSWSISGGRIEGDAKGKRIKFVPESDQKVTITYTNPNGENKSRSLIVQN